MRGAVFFDYDGTLVDERNGLYEVSKESKKTLKRLQENGYATLLCTGRSFAYVPESFMDVAMMGYITSNGAYVEVDQEEIFHNVYEKSELEELVSFFISNQINFMLEGQKACYIYNREEKQYQRFIEYYQMPTNNLHAFASYDGELIDKITIFDTANDAIEILKEYIKDTYIIRKHRSTKSFDFSKQYMNKAIGIQKFCEHFHINLKDTYAFGDGSNDKEMISYVGTGIVMKDHHQVLDKVADMYCDSPLEEGISKACIALGLIQEDSL